MISTRNIGLAGAIILLFFSLQPLPAQTITGTVYNAETNEPLVGANVLQVGTQNGAATGTNGRFTLNLMENESAEIRITYVGFQTKIIDTGQRNWPSDIYLKPKAILTNAVFVDALRVEDSMPMAYETLTKEEINKKNLGQDLTYLIGNLPSVVTTSDAGAGIGYTGVRIRGVDPTRINITINGIPVNDAESQAVFWVNMPDLASSVESIQVQRGVGTSTNGAAAFGASVNIQTSEMRRNAFAEINIGGGSFNTQKYNVKLGSGLLDNGWQIQGRLSKITSDGYIDRAFSDLKSFYLGAAHHDDRSLLRVDVFSGKETTYQAWYGVPEEKLDTDRTYNPAGMEKPGEPYEDQTDNYQQDHYQLHYSYQLTDNWKANIALHYTYGRGYYEEYKASQLLTNYKIEPVALNDTTIIQSDLVRQLWLDNHFYGAVFSTEITQSDWNLTIGGGYNQYRGDHFGKVIWARFAGESELGNRYYFNDAFKTDGNIYAKFNYFFNNGLSSYLDLQIRHIVYEFLGKDRRTLPDGGQQIVNIEQNDRLTFFNPKAGFVYQSGAHRFFASLAVAHKEPTRDGYVNSLPQNRPQPEALYDWEAGYQGTFEKFFWGVNLYYMDYENQLVPTGELNDVGAVVLQNVPDSYRAGIELQAGLQILPSLQWAGNATLSRNKIEKYTQYITNLDTDTQLSKTYTNTTIAFSPSFISSSIISFRKNGFTADFTTKYVSRQYLDNTESFSRSIDPYLVNDLRIGYSFGSINFVQNIKVTLQINNIFDEMYVSNGYTYGYITGGEEVHFEYYYPQAGRNFLAQVSIAF